MVKRLVVTIIGLCLLIGLPAGIKLWQFRVMGATRAVMPPETVTADTVRKERWPRTVGAVGSMVAVRGVTVAPELDGKIVKIDFESGDIVKAGDVLVQIDTSTEAAQLRSAQSAAALAQINLDRTRDLLAKRTVSKSEFDAAEAQFEEATAQVDTVRATIAKKTVRAPFAGRLGLRLVNLGQIVKVGDPIATLQTLDPIYVNFSVPQQRLSVLKPGTPVAVSTDAAPGETFVGEINAVNSEVDSVTRTVRVQATISNVEEKLRPGMFADVEVLLPTDQEVLAILATAVLYAPYGDSVFVIEDKTDPQTGRTQQVLRQQIVRLGRTRGDFVAVLTGLNEGESVVTSGVFKLRPHMTVVVDNALAPNGDLAPKPANK
jgi:membrane fusion protein, multidrug efflux system